LEEKFGSKASMEKGEKRKDKNEKIGGGVSHAVLRD
jgi:hypothetical protein